MKITFIHFETSEHWNSFKMYTIQYAWKNSSGIPFTLNHGSTCICQSKIFVFFPCVSSCERAWPFILINLNPLMQRMFCAKFGWNWSSICSSGKQAENVKSFQTDAKTIARQTALTAHNWPGEKQR